MCAHDPLLFEKILSYGSPTVAFDRRGRSTFKTNRHTQAHRESGALELTGRHFRHKLYNNFNRAALATERQQCCRIDLGVLTVEVKFDQDVSAGKPRAASA